MSYDSNRRELEIEAARDVIAAKESEIMRLLDVLKDIEKYADVWFRLSQQQAFGDIALRALSSRSVPR